MFDSYYGSFRTHTFAQVFPSFEVFNQKCTETLIPLKITEQSLTTLYYLLYARYGNSHIANRDQNQFIYSVFSTIFMYGPSWEKRLEVQDKLRGLSDEELVIGGKVIYNHSMNPSTQPSTSTLEELLTINDQNTSNYKKSKLEGWSILLSLLETDVTEEFIAKFKKLFLTVVAPDYPLLYTTNNENTVEI